jgi:hypothetical protein
VRSPALAVEEAGTLMMWAKVCHSPLPPGVQIAKLW